MTSQLDLDQGGSFRGWIRQYIGSSIGWIDVPADNVLTITVGGTTILNASVNIVNVNVASAVTVVLPSAVDPIAGAGALPRLYANNPITIIDAGGNALAFPITIQSFGTEKIMNLASIQITANYGSYTLLPNSSIGGWTAI